LLTRLFSLLDKASKPLPIVDLDYLVSAGKAAAPWHFAQANHRPLPALRRWWKLNVSEHLQPRDAESYSSAEKFIYNPSAWVLHYKAGLKTGPVASLRLQADYRQEGTLLHRVLDLLLATTGKSVDWQTCSQSELNSWMEEIWPPLLEQEGANLLLPGKRADALKLQELGKQAIWELIFQLRRAKMAEARANETLQPVSFVGGQIGGIIDLLARNQQNLIAVVDLKFGGMDVRERELRENRPLQLAIYGHLLRCQGQKEWPASAFFLLRRRRLIATTNTFFPDAKVVASRFPPGELQQCWTDFEQVWRWRRQQLDTGWVELTPVALDERNLLRVRPQVVQKQRAQNFHDITFAGVVRALLATCAVIHHTLKERTENGGRDFCPHKFAAIKQSTTHLRIETRIVEAFTKQSAVDVAKTVKWIRIFHRLVGGGFVQPVKKFVEPCAKVSTVSAGLRADELSEGFGLENERVFGEQAEKNSDEHPFQIVSA
jgi:hypothetical protein